MRTLNSMTILKLATAPLIVKRICFGSVYLTPAQYSSSPTPPRLPQYGQAPDPTVALSGPIRPPSGWSDKCRVPLLCYLHCKARCRDCLGLFRGRYSRRMSTRPYRIARNCSISNAMAPFFHPRPRVKYELVDCLRGPLDYYYN